MQDSNSRFAKQRPCPCCAQGTVFTVELPAKARCYHCQNLIEVNLFYIILVSLIFTVGILILVLFNFDIVAGVVLMLFVVFNAWLRRITTAFFPLKCYQDKDCE